MTLGERGRRGRHQRYAFVGGTEQHVESDVGGDDGIAVGTPHRGDRGARTEQAGIEEIGALASGLERELAELQHAGPHAQVDELGLIRQCHAGAVSQGKRCAASTVNPVRSARFAPGMIVRDANQPRTPPASLNSAILTEPAKPTLLQALSDKRMAAVLFLSFASGLPFNLTNFSLQAWLADSGLAIKTIGFLSLVALPYNAKFLWAPLLDRYLPPILGRRRGWIAVFQVCLAICIGTMGFCSPTRELYVLAGVALSVAFLSASQDIVIDAYRVDTIPPSERALAAAASAFGYRTAAMLAGTVLVVIAGHFGWRLAFLFVAALMTATLFATFWAPEPQSPATRPVRWPMRSGIHCGSCSAKRACGDSCCWCCFTRWAMRSP